MGFKVVSAFLSSYSADAKLPDNEKAFNGVEVLLQAMRSIEADFDKYYNGIIPTTMQWVTYEFPVEIKKIIDLFNCMKDLVTPFAVPVDVNNPAVKRRVAAFQNLPKDQTLLALGTLDHSPIKKLITHLNNLDQEYKKEVKSEAVSRGYNMEDEGYFWKQTRKGARGELEENGPGEKVTLSAELEQRQSWVERTKETLVNLDMKISQCRLSKAFEAK